MDGTMDRAGLELFGQIVSANAAAAARSSNDLTSYWAEQAKTMAEIYLTFFEAADRAADVVTSRRLEKVLAAALSGTDTAARIIEGAEHVLSVFDPEAEESE